MARPDAVTITIREPIDQESLERLRAALALHPSGRLTDDWDYKFGYRYVDDNDRASSAKVTLWRADDDPWCVVVEVPAREPSTEEIARWREEIIEGIKAAGLTPDPAT